MRDSIPADIRQPAFVGKNICSVEDGSNLHPGFPAYVQDVAALGSDNTIRWPILWVDLDDDFLAIAHLVNQQSCCAPDSARRNSSVEERRTFNDIALIELCDRTGNARIAIHKKAIVDHGRGRFGRMARRGRRIGCAALSGCDGALA